MFPNIVFQETSRDMKSDGKNRLGFFIFIFLQEICRSHAPARK